MVNSSENHLDIKEPIANAEFNDKPEWLTKDIFREFLINDFPNFQKINEFHVEHAVATGENFLTTMLRVTLNVTLLDSSTKSTSYMVKIMPKADLIQNLVKEWQVFEKELRTYTKYIPKFEDYYNKAGKSIKFAPSILKLNKVHIDEDVVLLEDLRLKGFKNLNRQLGLDMIHIKAVLEKMAEFHAASAHYAHMEEDEFPKLYDQCLPSVNDSFAELRANACRMLRDNLHLYGDVQHLNEKLKTYGETQCDSYQRKSERSREEFNVLNHGDLWINNIMFQYNEDGSLKETYFIDFQMSRYGSPAQDLIYFLFSPTNLENKIKHFDYFISYYHRKLLEKLELINYQAKVPKLRDIQTALFKHDYWCYTVITALLPVVLCEPRDDAKAENLMANEDFQRVLYSNPKFAEHMRIILPWLDNRGALDL